MGYTTDVEICNLALQKIGQKAITAAQLTTPGNNATAISCKTFFEPERDLLMESFEWRFSSRRVYYDIDNYVDTITATTAAEPVVVTGTDISDTNIEEYYGVYIYDTGISGLDGERFIVRNITDGSQTFELYNLDASTPLDGSAFSTATSGYFRAAPISEYDYMFKLPSDCLRIMFTTEDEEFTRDGDWLLTDNYEEYVEYISLITDVSKYPRSFINCLATKLAAELTIPLAKEDQTKANLLKEYEYYLNQAKMLGAIEVNPKNRMPKNLSSWQKAGR